MFQFSLSIKGKLASIEGFRFASHLFCNQEQWLFLCPKLRKEIEALWLTLPEIDGNKQFTKWQALNFEVRYWIQKVPLFLNFREKTSHFRYWPSLYCHEKREIHHVLLAPRTFNILLTRASCKENSSQESRRSKREWIKPRFNNQLMLMANKCGEDCQETRAFEGRRRHSSEKDYIKPSLQALLDAVWRHPRVWRL